MTDSLRGKLWRLTFGGATMLGCVCVISATVAARAAEAADTPEAASQSQAPPTKELLRGQVVTLRDALEKRGIPSSEEFEGQVVLEAAEGELIPIIPDWRGRAFYQDKRLRNRGVELIGYRREGVPYLQVLTIFTFDESGQRQYTDYWCDICYIPMYEIKPCDCCQGEIRLRFQARDLPDEFQVSAPSPSVNDDSTQQQPHPGE